MTPEIFWLTLTIIFTSLMWLPYILCVLIENKVIPPIMEGSGAPAPQQAWAQRLKKAHSNAIENLVIFAPLVLSLVFVGISNETTALLCMTYFWARVGHAVIYMLGIPVLRTVTFMAGVVCQLGLALTILGYI